MIEMIKAFYDKARKTIVEVIEGGKSVLRYRGNDKLYHYIPSYDTPSGPSAPTFKTVNGETITGTGNISFKTINGETLTGESDISTEVPVVTVSGATPTQQLAPNTFYKFGEITSLTITLSAPVSGILNIYSFSFTAGSGFDPSTNITWPDGVMLNAEIEMDAGDDCEVSIRDNHATFTVWTPPAASADPTND